MGHDPKAAAILRGMLETTRDEELDCDRFLVLLPSYMDGRLHDENLREQLEHHARQCPECAEELDILRRALDPENN